MTITTIIKRGKDLTQEDTSLMNEARRVEFGKKEEKNFKTDYPQKSKFFFVKDRKKTLSFGILIPIQIYYNGRTYRIYGVCSIISLKKKKGYGRILMHEMIDFLKIKEKTALGFSGKNNIQFYKRCGFEIEPDLIKHFQYKNPLTEEIKIDNDGDGFFVRGIDGFLDRVLKLKDIVYIDIPFW